VGTLLSFTGIFTWAAYSIAIRPSVVKAGGRRRRKGVFFRTFFQSLNASAKQSAAAKPKKDSSLSTAMSSTPAQPCGSCGGTGQHTCSACQGRGRHDSSTPSAYGGHAVDGWCSSCSGSGNTKCQTCSGSGKRSY
jgi:DnaJ-class molecular chaperone